MEQTTTGPRDSRYVVSESGLEIPRNGPRFPRSASFLAALLCALEVLPGAQAQQATNNQEILGAYKSLSLEQLMNLDVTSVARAPEPLGQAPSAIQVITGEDIRRSGASSIPEALRLADNLEVAQENSHDWAISARGFDANLADKLLVLVDGRAVYTPLYGGVRWNTQDILLEDVDRIEVISGPGGTLWGANAVNGVINITTKNARDTQGLYLETGGGTELQDFASVRYGGVLASNVYFRVYGKYSDHDNELLTNGANAHDSWNNGQGGFRIDSQVSAQNAATFQGDYYNGAEAVASLPDETFNGGNLLGRWVHTYSEDSDMSLQLYFDRTYLSVPYPAYSPATYFTGFPAGFLTDELDACDLDFQHSFNWGEHQHFVWGLGYRFTHEVDKDVSIVRFSPPTLDQNLFSGFIQDQIRLDEKVLLTLGSKIEHNDYTGFEVEPSGRLQINLTPKQMLWAAVSRAVQTPSRYDRDLQVMSGLAGVPPPYRLPETLLQGSPDFVSETVIAYELGYRAQLGSKVSASISTFYNIYHDLRSVTPTPTSTYYPLALPEVFGNNQQGTTYGIELNGNYQICENWRLHAGYDLLQEHIRVKPGQVDFNNGGYETADPQQQFSVRSSVDIMRDVSFDTGLRWVDELHMVESPTDGPTLGTVPSYFELDARIGWRVNKNIEVSVVGQNLLHDHHVEYGFPNASQEEIVRSVYAKLTYRW